MKETTQLRMYVSPSGDLPIYRQIMRQISDAVASGLLRPGDKLASQRDLAEQLVVAPLTVKKAYDELEREGVIRTERGRGTFVSSQATAQQSEAHRERLRETMRSLLIRAQLGGIALDEVVEMLEAMWRELDHQRRGQTEESRGER